MNAIVRALAACALFAAPTALTAQTEVVVQAPTLEQWSTRMTHELDRHIRYPRPDTGRLHSEGMARIRFNCSDTGAPADPVVYRSSGDRRLDRAALDAVRRLKTMHPLPAGIAHDQRYQAVIVFALSEESRGRQLRALMEEPEMRRLAMRGGPALALVAPVPVAPR